MKPLSITLIFTLLLLGLKFSAFAAETITLTPEQIKNMHITLTKPISANTPKRTIYSGEVTLPSNQESIVTSSQDGLLDSVNVALGQHVKKGQLLAHVSSKDMASVQSEYLQTLTRKNLAEKAYERDNALFKEGIIAQRRFLETESEYETAKAALSEKKQTLKLSGLSEQAIQQLAAKKLLSTGLAITSPMQGQVIEVMVNPGQRVDMTTPLMKIAQLNPLWVEINVPVAQAISLKIGTPVVIPGSAAKGHISAILRSVNKETQTMHVRAEIHDGAEQLAIGQFLEVELQTSLPAKSFAIPRSALARNGQNAVVFKQIKKGFEPVPVVILSEQGSQALITGPINDRDSIAVTGIAALKGSWLGLGGE